MSGKMGLLIVLVVAGAGLTYTVAERMSEQTIDVVVGLLCGVGATIPISVGLLIALTRRRRVPADEQDQTPEFPSAPAPYGGYSPRQPYPPVIVITPQQGQMPNPYGGLLAPGQMPSSYGMNESPMTREFKIIGDDDEGFDA